MAGTENLQAAARAVRCYRETLKRARYLGGDRGKSIRVGAQEKFLKLRNTQSTAEFENALSSVESCLSYLRMITPRYAGGQVEASNASAKDFGGTCSFVMRDGKLERQVSAKASSSNALSSFTGSNIDPESVGPLTSAI